MFQEELVSLRVGEGLAWGAFMAYILLFSKH